MSNDFEISCNLPTTSSESPHLSGLRLKLAGLRREKAQLVRERNRLVDLRGCSRRSTRIHIQACAVADEIDKLKNEIAEAEQK